MKDEKEMHDENPKFDDEESQKRKLEAENQRLRETMAGIYRAELRLPAMPEQQDSGAAEEKWVYIWLSVLAVCATLIFIFA